ncbi:MAG: hypothetical protein NTY60_06035 [Proteobacteria bacterium]|nr:hypothetical protein [Pseudomonadota bacterium]
MLAFSEKLGLVLVSVVAGLIFATYRLLMIVLVLLVPLWLFDAAIPGYRWYLLGVPALAILLATSKSVSVKENPYRKYTGFTGWTDARIDQFIAWVGTLKYFTSPLCLVEDPGSYQLRGYEIRHLIDGALQPGDILLRGYDGYLDGKLISLSGGAQGSGKYFSHAALYLGELTAPQDQIVAARRLKVVDESGVWQEAGMEQKQAVRNNPAYFQTGKQMVVHAMSKGIFVEDILTFSRCDYLAVLRLPDRLQLLGDDFNNKTLATLSEDGQAINSQLQAGLVVEKGRVVNAIHDSALGKIGSCYDFQFNDIKTAHRFSCSEFVYYCFKSVHSFLGLQPKKHAFMGIFFSRLSITPADIFEAAGQRNRLQIIWRNQALIDKGG